MSLGWLRGMQWKTAWRRRRPAVPPVTTDMWFFANFVHGSPTKMARYQLPALSPLAGETLPFWRAAVFAIEEGAGYLASFSDASGAGGGFRVEGDEVPTGAEAGQRRTRVSFAGSSTPIMQGQKPDLVTLYQAVPMLMTVETLGTGVGWKATLWMDGTIVDSYVNPAAYVAPSALLAIEPNGGYLHGVAGGAALPTSAEIRTWFAQTKSLQEIQAIPGKTSDRWSATSVAPAVPNPLPNLETGQGADYVVVTPLDPPSPVNVLLPVAFGY